MLAGNLFNRDTVFISSISCSTLSNSDLFIRTMYLLGDVI